MEAKIKRRQYSYCQQEVQECLKRYKTKDPSESNRSYCRKQNLPRSTLVTWRAKAKENEPPKTKGRPARVPFEDQLLAYMEETRMTEKFLTSTTMLQWLSTNQNEWLHQRFGSLNDNRAYKQFQQWCRRFAKRYKYKYRVPCPASRLLADMVQERD